VLKGCCLQLSEVLPPPPPPLPWRCCLPPFGPYGAPSSVVTFQDVSGNGWCHWVGVGWKLGGSCGCRVARPSCTSLHRRLCIGGGWVSIWRITWEVGAGVPVQKEVSVGATLPSECGTSTRQHVTPLRYPGTALRGWNVTPLRYLVTALRGWNVTPLQDVLTARCIRGVVRHF
jgi:hypothetical protein